MQTIKTFVVVGLLMAVCYGAFVALNAPEVSIPEELEQWAQSTNDKELQEFEIPTLSVPETYPQPSSPSAFSQSNPKPGDSIPQFPTNSSLPSLSSPLPTADLQFPSSQGESFPSTHSAQADSSNLSPPSGATLTSVPVATSVPIFPGATENGSGGQNQVPKLPDIPFLENATGPSIPFNASSASTDPTADDLIGAIGELGPHSSENITSTLTSDSTSTITTQKSSPDPGLLASRSNTGGEANTSGEPNTSNQAGDSNPDGSQKSNSLSYSEARTQALQLAETGELTEALDLLSQYYESPELDYAEHSDLVDILDALAREVIYSDRSLLRPKYTVSAQDSLASLADKHRVNPELVAAINQMGQSQALVANTQIKLIDGPFRAQVSLSRGELTLFLRKMYAGRFPVSISQKNKPEPGTYEIVDRRQDRTFYSANAVIPAEAPTNPYGGYWLDLGGNLAIHGSPEQVSSELEGAGCISLAPLDAADVYRILSKGAAVEIRP